MKIPNPVVMCAVLGALLVTPAAAQQPTASRSAGAELTRLESLDQLVAVGLRDNLTRRAEQFNSQRAQAQVAEARGRYLPSATINARYTEVGGNVVDLGKLINPAFGALNQLLARPAFPTDLNLKLPQRQETTVRLAQPLFQPAIGAAYAIATRARDAQLQQQGAVSRQLALDLRTAYLNSVKARRVVDIYAAAVPLVEENVRLAERLVAAGSATPDVVFRARAERSDVLQKRDDAERQAVAAREVVNLLLDRPLDASLPLLDDAQLGIDSLPALETALARAHGDREELHQLDALRGITKAQQRLVQASFYPNVAFAVDYGIQGNNYRFARDADFTQASLVLSWNLFNGSQDAARAEQASIDARRVESQKALAERQIELQVRTSWAAASTARTAIATANDRAEAARRTWELTRRRYEQGMAPQLELLDARTNYTAAEINRVLTTYDFYLRRAELDRAAALYPRSTP
jgi:outer membrane protein TolC